jgi:hypothetical protein
VLDAATIFNRKIAAYTQQSLDFKKKFFDPFRRKPGMQSLPEGHGCCYFISTTIFSPKITFHREKQ